MSDELAMVPAGPADNPLAPVPVEVMDAMERSRIDLQISAARRNPRPDIAVIEKSIHRRATRRADIAELCYYSLPRFDKETGKNKIITGASIKLANIALGEWGNTLSGARTVANDGLVIKAYGICWDLQTNNQKFAEVQRRIVDKHGRPYSYDMQIVTAQAANSIAERNAILKVLGDDLYVPILNDCMKVAAGTAGELVERREKAMRWFSTRGVKYEQILQLLEKGSVEQLDSEDVGYLSGLANAIRDKEISIQDAFAAQAEGDEQSPKQSLRDKLLARRAEKAAKEAK